MINPTEGVCLKCGIDKQEALSKQIECAKVWGDKNPKHEWGEEGEKELRERVEAFCTTDNFSAPPYEVDVLVEFISKELAELEARKEGEMRDAYTRGFAAGVEKKEAELTTFKEKVREMIGKHRCRDCSERGDSCPLNDGIDSMINDPLLQ